jgi:carbonic anhydrase/acetyltransferase-like protein (isoleucine patch superfamily)
MTTYRLNEHAPQIASDAWIAPGARVVGRACLEPASSVWFGAVIRADNETIHIGSGSNIQEGAVLHVDPGYPLKVGREVTVGHQAMLHGCTIGDRSLVGIQAVVLNGAVIGRECLVAAGALVTEGKVFPDRSLILGAPAKAVRQLSDEEVAALHHSAADYVVRATRYRHGLEGLD